MKFQKLMSAQSDAQFEVRLGMAVLMSTNDENDAIRYLESIESDTPDAKLYDDGVLVTLLPKAHVYGIKTIRVPVISK